MACAASAWLWRAGRLRPAPAKRAARLGQEPQPATSANARSAIPASPSRLQGSGKATAPAARQCARNPLACVQARRLREAPPNARAARNDVERAGPPRPCGVLPDRGDRLHQSFHGLFEARLLLDSLRSMSFLKKTSNSTGHARAFWKSSRLYVQVRFQIM